MTPVYGVLLVTQHHAQDSLRLASIKASRGPVKIDNEIISTWNRKSIMRFSHSINTA